MGSRSQVISIHDSVAIYEYLLKSMQSSAHESSERMPQLKIFIGRAISKLQSYYNCSSVIADISTILDPRKKMLFFEKARANDPEDIIGIKEQFGDAFYFYKRQLIDQPESSSSVPVVEVSGLESFLGVTTNIAQEGELDLYLMEPPVNMTPLEYWKINATRFRVLATMARDYLAACASSVLSEQVFSGGVDVIVPNRMALNDGSISKLMLLKSWLRNW